MLKNSQLLQSSAFHSEMILTCEGSDMNIQEICKRKKKKKKKKINSKFSFFKKSISTFPRIFTKCIQTLINLSASINFEPINELT